jgi:hypothetical protein
MCTRRRRWALGTATASYEQEAAAVMCVCVCVCVGGGGGGLLYCPSAHYCPLLPIVVCGPVVPLGTPIPHPTWWPVGGSRVALSLVAHRTGPLFLEDHGVQEFVVADAVSVWVIPSVQLTKL